MLNAQELLDFFNKSNPVDRYNREDKLEDVISLLAFNFISNENYEELSVCLNHPRFNSFCSHKLLVNYLRPYGNYSILKKETNNAIIMDKYEKGLVCLLNSNYVNFSHYYRENRIDNRLFNYDYDNDTGVPDCFLNHLVMYVLYNKIYIEALANDMDEYIDSDTNMNEVTKSLMETYIKRVRNKDSIINNTFYLVGRNISLTVNEDPSEILNIPILFYDRVKQNHFINLLGIGFHFNYEALFESIENIPFYFNVPAIHFKECCEYYNQTNECEFEENEIKRIIDIFYQLHNDTYK